MKKNILLTMLSMTAFVPGTLASNVMVISTQVQTNDSLSGIPSYPENATLSRLTLIRPPFTSYLRTRHGLT